jgi:hypothetical protein
MKKSTLFWLGTILVGAMLLRLPAIGWGLPLPIPHVIASGSRCSYAFDEDDILTSAARSNPRTFDFDPLMYHWGTLHLHLVQVWMEAVEASGFVGHEWRDAYYRMIPGAFERVYVAGRMLSTIMALLCIVLVFLLGREFGGDSAGLWSAALVAVSPVHLLASVQIRVDLTMVVVVVITMWLALRTLNAESPKLLLLMGLTAGLAFSAKPIAVVTVAPVVVFALWRRGAKLATWVWVAALTAAGFIIGQPYIFVKWQEMFRQVYAILQTNLSIPSGFNIPIPLLLLKHGLNALRFLLGLPAFLLASAGLVLITRRRSAPAGVILCALLGGIVSLFPLAWPLLRYELPLLPVLSVAAAVALTKFRPLHRTFLGSAALAFPLFASFAQLAYMRSPHPANQVLQLILKEIPPKSTISRLVVDLPPLDRRVYPMGPNPFLQDFSSNPPEWVLTADLPEQEYPAANRRTLETRYDLRGDFQIPRIFAWATLGESNAPHDWKYTHPHMALYRRLPR